MGYETYQKILNEAVRELKEEEFGDLFPTSAKKDETDDGRSPTKAVRT
ncbi:MAG: hypothetical protein MZV63_52210 [Marinilabiliales bacterium]|nr:hypothetical protein [Marinilabiliales bacterium]